MSALDLADLLEPEASHDDRTEPRIAAVEFRKSPSSHMRVKGVCGCMIDPADRSTFTVIGTRPADGKPIRVCTTCATRAAHRDAITPPVHRAFAKPIELLDALRKALS